MRRISFLAAWPLSLALLLAAACGGGKGSGADPTPTPTPVVLPQGGASFTWQEWSEAPPPPSLVDFTVLTPENLRAIRETVERHEELRHQWECALSLEGFPVREVATENRIAAIERYLAGQREIGLCEVITSTYTRARIVLLRSDRAVVYADRQATVRYFDPRTGEEAKEPAEYTHVVGWVLVPAGGGRWLVDEIGVVQQQQ